MKKESGIDGLVWASIISITLLLLLTCCTKMVYVPVESVKTITKTERDTIIEVSTPYERVVNSTVDTTSVISTRYATSTAEIRNGILRHELTQHARKDSVKTQIVTIHETDSIPFAVPYPVPEQYVPPWCWWLSVIAFILICVSIYICVKK